MNKKLIFIILGILFLPVLLIIFAIFIVATIIAIVFFILFFVLRSCLRKLLGQRHSQHESHGYFSSQSTQRTNPTSDQQESYHADSNAAEIIDISAKVIDDKEN